MTLSMKLIWGIIFSLLVGVANATPDKTCLGKVKSLVRDLKKLRPTLVATIDETLNLSELHIGELRNLLKVLKEEQETFLDIYTNRSSLKRPLSTDERNAVMESFGWTGKSADEIQTLYGNRLKGLIIKVDELFREKVVEINLMEYQIEANQTQIKLLSTGLLFLNSKPTYPAEIIGMADSMDAYKKFRFFDQGSFYRIMLSANTGEVNWEQLNDYNVLPGSIFKWKDTFEKPYSFYCCFEAGNTRCTLCPYRIK